MRGLPEMTLCRMRMFMWSFVAPCTKKHGTKPRRTSFAVNSAAWPATLQHFNTEVLGPKMRFLQWLLGGPSTKIFGYLSTLGVQMPSPSGRFALTSRSQKSHEHCCPYFRRRWYSVYSHGDVGLCVLCCC